MIKICIFVEGRTEQLFVKYLLQNYLTNVQVDSTQTGKGHPAKKSLIIIKAENLLIQIRNSGNDNKVISDIKEYAAQMIKKEKFNFLLGLRDLYPNKYEDKKRIIENTQNIFYRTNYEDNLKLILAVMETEAWFLADYNLFEKIEKKLTPEYIQKKLKIDLIKDDPETNIKHPKQIVKNIFKLIDKKYDAKEDQIYKICHNIDYNFLLFLEKKIDSFKYFLKVLDSCMEIKK